VHWFIFLGQGNGIVGGEGCAELIAALGVFEELAVDAGDGDFGGPCDCREAWKRGRYQKGVD
jgi:hypothetical protein